VSNQSKIISLGMGAYVDAEQIVAVDMHIDTNHYSMGNFETMKSAVLLKNGCVVPAWVGSETVKKRWEKALMART